MSDATALGFANAPLGSSSGLRGWLEQQGSIDEPNISELTLRLREFAELQGWIRELLEASVRGSALPADALEHLNETSARVPTVLRLGPEGASHVPLAGSAASLVLARLAWSSIELLGGQDRSRLRRCPACGRYFLATRPDRVWCSDACGNRTRVARHHARRRART